ncbi:MAG: hypothetical protein WCQ16_02130 [Verrucomicrobiae bacterium]
MKTLLLLFLSLSSCLAAQDVLFLRNGERRAGRITAADALVFRLEVPLPARPGMPPAFASVSIPKSQVSHIEFARDPALEEIFPSASPAQLPEIAELWSAQFVWLDVPKSPAARVGCLYGDLLLRAGGVENATKALEIFRLIESKAWSDADKTTAKKGRLRAMVATGRAKDAVSEAEQLAASTGDPAVLLEAKFILAETAAASLKKLLHDNPRWQEDAAVIPERNRLYHEAIDLYLYPSLFEGSGTTAAARGLWGAIGIYQLAGEPQNALECARDIAIIYPGTEQAVPANDLIATLAKIPPPGDAENVSVPKKQAPENLPSDKPKKKSHETKKPKKS